MSRVSLVGVAALVGMPAALLVACSSLSSDAEGSTVTGDPDGSRDGDGGALAPSEDGVVANASGVVVAHAADFTSFRLCFDNYPELAPQPDGKGSKVMPQANLVGVDVGSAVRIDPLPRAPGMVYVINERSVRSVAGTTDEIPCGQRICKAGDTSTDCLEENTHYLRAGSIDHPIGVDAVDVLAVTGCGWNRQYDGGVAPGGCGADWDSIKGNLKTTVLTVPASPRADSRNVPVRVLHLATFVDTLGSALSVGYGDLTAGATLRPLATDAPLFQLSPAASFDVPDGDNAVYATHGFRLSIADKDAGSTVTVEQSLAEVQNLSAPNIVPDEYYKAASNYALLVLGDPAVKADAGAVDVRRALHVLAVPVVDPNADAGAPQDAGVETLDGGADR